MRILSLILVLFSFSALSFDFTTKGFIVLDIANLQKIEGENSALEMGYGTADVKFYFNHGDFSSKVKLDIDSTSTDTNLMEEALVMYRPARTVKFTFGKGKIRFHQMHHGITERNVTDGGNIHNMSHALRDQDKKLMAMGSFGRRKNGFVAHFSIYGDEMQVDKDRDDDTKPYLRDSGSTVSYDHERSFNTKYQRGFATKLEFSPSYETKFSVSALQYYRDIDPDRDYAFDAAFHHNTYDMEFWGEYIWAYTSKHPNDKYTNKRQYDKLYQLGALYKFLENHAVGLNVEYTIVQEYHHDRRNYDSDIEGQTRYNDGMSSRSETLKLDFGFQYKPQDKLQLSYGVIVEEQKNWDSPQQSNKFLATKYLGKTYAYSINCGLSFWF